MSVNNKLASQLAVALSVAALVATSAFADNRHSDRTSRGGRDRGRESHTSRDQRGDHSRSDNRSFDRGRTENRDRSFDRGRTENRDRSFGRGRSENRDRNFDRGRSGSFRNDFRGHGDSHGRSFDRGRPYFASGRVSHYERFGGGYRVFLFGVPYPFFIPEARFRLFPHFHIGLSLRLGGYYNPGGYYDYYDGPYDGGHAYTEGGLRGVVESVDIRRGQFIVHDDVSNAFVTVVMRGDDRRLYDLRLGDYVGLSGDWTRTGVFQAYRIDNLDRQGGFYR